MVSKYKWLRYSGVLAIGAAGFAAIGGAPAEAAPSGMSSVSVNAEKVLREPISISPGLDRSVRWCQPMAYRQLRIDSFYVAKTFQGGYPVFAVNISECQTSWFGPKLGAVPFTKGMAQLEVFAGPETWNEPARILRGWQDSEYFQYAYVGTYSVRIKVWSEETGAFVYSEPVNVEITLTNLNSEIDGGCSRADVGTTKVTMEYLGGLGVGPRPVAFVRTCVTRSLGGPRSVVASDDGDGSCLTIRLVDPSTLLDTEVFLGGAGVPSAVWDAFPGGTWTFEATCSSPNWDGVPGTVTVKR
jgi:hypothetical protein